MEKNRCYVLDGAMGTMLQLASLAPGEAPELYQMRHPEVVLEVHRQYVEAGSDIIYTNTFGANAHKLKESGFTVAQVVMKAVELAKQAAQGNAKVALDIGPIGELLEPNGYLSFESAYDIFAEIMEAGVSAGVDLIVLETMSDLMEVKAGILAAKEHSNLPVFVTMSFEEDGRTFTGCKASSFALMATALGVDAIGINCSLGPDEIYPIAKQLRAYTHLPLIIKANAGLPDPKTGAYHIDAQAFANSLLQFADLQVHYLGGCCGSDPSFIQAIKSTYPLHVETSACRIKEPYLCTSTTTLKVEDVQVIGERINPTGNKVMKEALLQQDYAKILQIALEEIEAGAAILDVNVGLPGIDEKTVMVQVIKELQGVVEVPLQIDSTNPDVIEAALRVYCGIPIVNSINGEASTMQKILPLIQKYGACVVGLTMDERGILEDAKQRVAIGKHIIETAQSYGISKHRIFLDCLTLTVSAQQKGALQTLEALRLLKEEQVKTVLGVSNISFGLPNRINLNQNFLTMALQAGLCMPIINPNQSAMMQAVRSYRVLTCIDIDAQDYIAHNLTTPVVTNAPQPTMTSIQDAIRKGLKEETRQLTLQLLQEKAPLQIVDEDLIPALDIVGQQYERKELYLPQLINAATASQMAFQEIQAFVQKSGEASLSKGKILLATVKGDVHDIGKNIVKVVLESHGYQVFDLGKDVAVETIVEVAQAQQISLIGLSALMTTTLPAMEASIQALKAVGHPCKIMVGGAVVSPDYAMQIGADYYAKDAKASADIAKEVLG